MALPTAATRSPRLLSVISATLILVGGYVHLCLYRHGYRFIPTIGASFVLQFGSSVIATGALLVWARRVKPRRHRVDPAQLTRLAAVGLTVTTLAALGMAHTSTGLFNFHEIGLRPAPQTVIAIVAESSATVLLATAMVQTRTSMRHDDIAGRLSTPGQGAVRDAA